MAGVAALVWAADPTLSATQVWDAMRITAQEGVGGTRGTRRRVNAFGAVAAVLGGSPPTVTLEAPASADLGREVVINGQVQDAEYGAGFCPAVACPLTFSPEPERVVGNVAYYRFRTPGPVSVSTVSINLPANPTTHPLGVPLQFLGNVWDINEGPDPGPAALACRWTSSLPTDSQLNLCSDSYTFSSEGPRIITLTGTDAQGLTTSTSVLVTITPPPTNLPPTVTTSPLPTPNYETSQPWAGYEWSSTVFLSGSAVDPEGNTPITYRWIATSYVPYNPTASSNPAVFLADVLIGTAPGLVWVPQITPSLFVTSCTGDAYWGQVVRVRLEATDSLGNSASRSLPDLWVYRCILG